MIYDKIHPNLCSLTKKDKLIGIDLYFLEQRPILWRFRFKIQLSCLSKIIGLYIWM